MDFSLSHISSDVSDMYRLRINPIVEQLIKSSKIDLNEHEKKGVIDLMLPEMLKTSAPEFMAFSNKALLHKLGDLMSSERFADLLSSAQIILKQERSNYDIRHKETLRLFLREYFQLFMPDLAKRMVFDTAQFLDKELIALFGGQHRFTDALILIQIVIDNEPEYVLLFWEQQGKKEAEFVERMFHGFCGLYFQYRRLILSIAMFTDMANWTKPVSKQLKMSLSGYPIIDYTYHMIKLKDYSAKDFEKIGETNPLAYAYLPLTDYPKKNRPIIKAKAMNGVANAFEEGTRRATLLSLIEECIKLDDKETGAFNKLIHGNPYYKEVEMLKSIKEYWFEEGLEKGREEGIEKGREEGLEEGRKKLFNQLLQAGVLTKNNIEQAAQATGMGYQTIQKIARI